MHHDWFPDHQTVRDSVGNSWTGLSGIYLGSPGVEAERPVEEERWDGTERRCRSMVSAPETSPESRPEELNRKQGPTQQPSGRETDRKATAQEKLCRDRWNYM